MPEIQFENSNQKLVPEQVLQQKFASVQTYPQHH
jgi:hypothetical protein